MSNSCWLPELEYLDSYDNEWRRYESVLYSIFKADFIDSRPSFECKQVNIRRHPMEYNKEEAFFNCDTSKCEGCEGIKVWSEPYKATSRVHILLEEERYMVVLERRDSYCLLITAFYFNYDHALEKKLKRYEMYKKSC